LPCSSPPAALPPTEPDTLSLHDALPIFSLGESAERVVADEPARPPQLVHDFVAGVDAVGAADAFHLQAVPDIDPGRTDRNAAEAVDAVASFLSLLGARLAARRVIADDDRVLIDQRRLEATVRADDQAGLLAEPRIVEVEHRGPEEGPSECGPVPGRSRSDVLEEVVHRNEVGEKRVRDPGRENQVDRVLDGLAPDSIEAERSGVPPDSALTASFDPAFDLAEQTFGEHRLRTGPAAPHPSEDRRDHEEAESHSDQEEEREVKVLVGEGGAEEVRGPSGQIEMNRGTPADLDPGKRQVDRDEQPIDEGPPPLEPAPHVRHLDGI